MEQSDIIIRRVQTSDTPNLLNLYDLVWPNVDYDKLAKLKFMLDGSKGVSYCAETRDKTVGSHLSIYQNFYYGNKKMRCVETGDTCVDPSCQGMGVFQKIYYAFRRDFFDNEKGELIWGISAPGAVKSFTKAGKSFIDTTMKLRLFSQPLQTFFKIGLNLRKLNVPIEWDKQNVVDRIDENLLKIRESELVNRKLLHIRYDEETIRWRLTSNSGIKSYCLADTGYFFYKIGKRGNVVEVEVGEVFLYKYTITSMKKLFKQFKKEYRPDVICVIVSVGHPLMKFYKKMGFMANPRKKYLPHCVLAETEEMKKIGYNPNNWAVSSLDLDTF